MPAHRVQHIKAANLYLVRLWAQDQDIEGDASDSATPGSANWQGRVQRVIDGESHQFDNLQGLVDLLLQMLSGKAK
jgi:hypothetical protein